MVLGHGDSERGQFGDLPVQGAQLVGQLLTYVGAGRVPGVADPQDLVNLGKAEASFFTAPDEFEPADRLGGVLAVSTDCTADVGQEAALFVEP
ncbi:hypothetical protein ACVWY0_003674 [Arthrobacter sp. UYNi723]